MLVHLPESTQCFEEIFAHAFECEPVDVEEGRNPSQDRLLLLIAADDGVRDRTRNHVLSARHAGRSLHLSPQMSEKKTW